MNPDQRLTITIGSAWGMLYVASVIVAGLVLHCVPAVLFAAATAAICYLTCLVQVLAPDAYRAALCGVVASIIFGGLAGLSLLV